ncbi:MAG: nuclear transport factor 2 family protein [Acidobacteria bacterium]|nr:MAG: nuclear transport factor 2 family protein [Acidobacteriota bacterium]
MLVAVALAALLTAAPSAEEKAVLAAVQGFFDSMVTKDAEAAKKILIPEGRLFSVRVQDGKKIVRSSSNQDFIDGLAKSDATWLERMWDPEVRIRGDIATVWTPYDFHINGKFSHCGIDAFDLVKKDGAWMISGGTYTVERTGCTDSPLGPPQ